MESPRVSMRAAGELDKGRALLNDAARQEVQSNPSCCLHWPASNGSRVVRTAAPSSLAALDRSRSGQRGRAARAGRNGPRSRQSSLRRRAASKPFTKPIRRRSRPPMMLARMALAKDDAKRADEFVNAAMQASSEARRCAECGRVAVSRERSLRSGAGEVQGRHRRAIQAIRCCG